MIIASARPVLVFVALLGASVWVGGFVAIVVQSTGQTSTHEGTYDGGSASSLASRANKHREQR